MLYFGRTNILRSKSTSNELTPTWTFMLSDKPGAPGAPLVDAVGGDFVNLTWDKAHDGGGRLLGYIIEKREASADKWSRVNYEVSVLSVALFICMHVCILVILL